MSIWLEVFIAINLPNGAVRDLCHILEEPPFSTCLEILPFSDHLRADISFERDKKLWMLSGNGAFSVKSLHNFLNDGGLCCAAVKFFSSNTCPKKINIFNWLVWKNKILTLENLEKRRCNQLSNATYVLCHAGIKSIDCLFLQCPLVK